MQPGDISELPTIRLRALVNDLGAELGTKRGWKRIVADLLHVHHSYVSRLLSPRGDLRVGPEVISRIQAEHGIPKEFFLDPHYRGESSMIAAVIIARMEQRDLRKGIEAERAAELGKRLDAANARRRAAFDERIEAQAERLERIEAQAGQIARSTRETVEELGAETLRSMLPAGLEGPGKVHAGGARVRAAMHSLMVVADDERPVMAERFLEAIREDVPIFAHHAAALERLRAGDMRGAAESAVLLALSMLERQLGLDYPLE